MAINKLEETSGTGDFKTIIDLNKVNECKSEFDEAKDSVTEVIDAFNKETFNHYDINGLKEVYENIKNTSLKIKAINERISRSMQTYEEKVTENETNLCNNMDGVTEFIGSGNNGAFGGTVSDNVKTLINNNNPKGNYHFSLKETPDNFVTTMISNRIGYDEGFGYQCVAGFKYWCMKNGVPVYAAPNIGLHSNGALSYWDNRNGATSGLKEYGTFIPMNEIDKYGGLQDGDWMFSNSSVAPRFGHVSMYYQGQQFGQNQGGVGRFNLYKFDAGNVVGVWRPNKYNYV